jgi:dolichol-phosphate mannosyltransferase
MAVSPKTKYILTMDADLNHHPEEIPLFLQEAKEHNTDIIIGSRGVHGASTANIPKWKMLVSNIANQTFKLITSIPVVDKTAGYKLYKREVIQHIAPYIKSRNFEFQVEILLLAKKFGYTMSEVPITFTYRIHGKSKMSLIKTAYGCFVLLLKVLFRRTQ